MRFSFVCVLQNQHATRMEEDEMIEMMVLLGSDVLLVELSACVCVCDCDVCHYHYMFVFVMYDNIYVPEWTFML